VTPFECEFESETLAAVLQSRWPERVDATLREHIAGCPICSDVTVIAGVIEAAREEMSASVTVPDSGSVWRRAQLRARREAAEAANRPITAAQVIAFACALGLLGVCARAVFAELDFGASLPAATTLMAQHGALLLAVGAMLFLIPAAVYLAMGRD